MRGGLGDLHPAHMAFGIHRDQASRKLAEVDAQVQQVELIARMGGAQARKAAGVTYPTAFNSSRRMARICSAVTGCSVALVC